MVGCRAVLPGPRVPREFPPIGGEIKRQERGRDMKTTLCMAAVAGLVAGAQAAVTYVDADFGSNTTLADGSAALENKKQGEIEKKQQNKKEIIKNIVKKENLMK
eukprot:TRINITY_DN79398_c0_g3_i4.p3 TRINITY_DN79398_c0_g3~~TRINITY_DN79398_c0_g3_i4.p3  ORF type:complete len:104 (-),score=19.41 TRINITY_DN79398_c0_g3_i4:1-312(-)